MCADNYFNKFSSTFHQNQNFFMQRLKMLSREILRLNTALRSVGHAHVLGSMADIVRLIPDSQHTWGIRVYPAATAWGRPALTPSGVTSWQTSRPATTRTRVRKTADGNEQHVQTESQPELRSFTIRQSAFLL